MKVIDASAMIEVLRQTPKATAIEALMDDDLFAPELLIAEVVHHFRHLVLGKTMSATDASRVVEVFEAADIEYTPVWPMTTRIWQLHHHLSAYDATYIALAEELGCPLLTTDKRLSKTHNVTTAIIVI
ncbi:MAG: type II toxin-antitoxin system VapC family toxin [Ilumatobacteraceae bacterium]